MMDVLLKIDWMMMLYNLLTLLFVSFLLKTGSHRLLGGKQLPQDNQYCLLPSVDTAKSRHERKLHSQENTLLLLIACAQARGDHLEVAACVESCCLPPRNL